MNAFESRGFTSIQNTMPLEWHQVQYWSFKIYAKGGVLTNLYCNIVFSIDNHHPFFFHLHCYEYLIPLEYKTETNPDLALPCSIPGGDLMILAPPVHLQILQVVKTRENWKDQSPSLEKQRKRSTSQEPNTPVVMVKRLVVPCHFLDFLEAWRTNGAKDDARMLGRCLLL